MPASTDVNNTLTSESPALTLFGKMLTFTRIKLETANLDDIAKHLESILNDKKSQIPVVIDSDIEQDLTALIDLFWSWGLQPIGVVTGVLDEAAKELKLAIFPADGKRIERIRPTKKATTQPSHTPTSDSNKVQQSQVANEQSEAASTHTLTAQNTQDADNTQALNTEVELAATETEKVTSMIYDQMLRSGQSINHVGGDLIITASVNNGAEVITDNSLHIYGRAQGRLVAGATGDKDARIFCQCFNPSLVSVAGTYCLKDNIPKEFIDKPVQVSFKEEEGLVFELMNHT